MTIQRADTKQKILRAAYELFYRQGISRVSVDAIAARAGVTKRTVYYHFASKDEIAGGVLDVQHLLLMQQFEGWVGGVSGGVTEILSALFDKLEAWSERPDWLGSGFSRIAAELADMPGHPARQAAKRHKGAVEAWLAERLGDAGAMAPEQLARQVMVLIEGAMGLALIHNDRGYITAAGHAARSVAQVNTPTG
ncbi:MAG: TetR/AcrR family transcriptional regulator [Silicimonas sp.]|nr:TetR/AcrR family transcriptional regulator [Silicimonas sp.]